MDEKRYNSSSSSSSKFYSNGIDGFHHCWARIVQSYSPDGVHLCTL